MHKSNWDFAAGAEGHASSTADLIEMKEQQDSEQPAAATVVAVAEQLHQQQQQH